MTRWFTIKGFFRNSDEIDQLVQDINENADRRTLDAF